MMRILLISQTRDEEQLYGQMLSSAGFEVCAISSQRLALDSLPHDALDAAVVTVDGDPISLLKNHPLLQSLPLIRIDDEDALPASGGIDAIRRRELDSASLARHIHQAVDRRKAELTIRIYKKALDTMQLGVTVTDLQGTILYVNPAEARMHGYTVEELMGKAVRTLSPEELWHLSDSEELQARKSWRRDSVNLRKDGTQFPVRLLSDVLTDEAGRPLGMVTSCEDLTERKVVQQVLRESEEKYRTIIDNIEDGYYEMDLTGSLRFFNDSLARILGYPPEEMIGMNHRSYMDEMNARKSSQILNIVRTTGRPARALECQILRKDGKRRDIELSASPVRDSNGQVNGFRGIVRDVTDRKSSERFVLERTKVSERAKALERSNRELEQFAYIASHDLQEPLLKIQAFGERFMDKFAGTLSDEGRDYLERMLNAGKRMQIMIRDLLTFARVSTKTHPFAPVELNRLLHEVISDLEVVIERTHATVRIDKLPTIDADETQMRQLFQNMVSNALKFSRRDVPPEVRITAETTAPNDSAESELLVGFCRISVQDNGIGFEERYLDRIFLPFNRLHGRGDYEGSGIGLAICNKIVQRHNGTINATSVPGEGSEFVITLPLKQPAQSSSNNPAE